MEDGNIKKSIVSCNKIKFCKYVKKDGRNE